MLLSERGKNERNCEKPTNFNLASNPSVIRPLWENYHICQKYYLGISEISNFKAIFAVFLCFMKHFFFHLQIFLKKSDHSPSYGEIFITSSPWNKWVIFITSVISCWNDSDQWLGIMMNTTFFRAVYLRYNEYNYALKPSFCITASKKTFKIHGVFFDIRAYKGINIGNLLYFVLCNNFPDLYRSHMNKESKEYLYQEMFLCIYS